MPRKLLLALATFAVAVVAYAALDDARDRRPALVRGDRVKVHLEWQDQAGPLKFSWVEGELVHEDSDWIALRGTFPTEFGFSAGPELCWVPKHQVALVIQQE